MSFDYLKSEGLSGTFRAILAHRFTVGTIKAADLVVLPSRYGLREYQRSDARFNTNATYFPLIFDDEAPADISVLLPQKRYFGYLGSLCRSHGFDQYLSFIRHAFEYEMNVQFLIASRNPLPEDFLSDSLVRKNLDRIEIRCGRPLGNEEMNRCYAESFCVWNLYRRSTQSAVLPKAFMFGTPVIATSIGSFPEYIQEGVNGRFAEAQDREEIWSVLQDMRDNIGRYAASCRQTFLDLFYYRSRLQDLREILR